jgi:Ribosomal protein L7Ae/L30e/S12e/Gadd45 family
MAGTALPPEVALRCQGVTGWRHHTCREVAKWVRVGKARAVIVAPNIEPAEGEAGLSSLLGGILGDAAARGIPVVFALSRKRMGQVGMRLLRLAPRC